MKSYPTSKPQRASTWLINQNGFSLLEVLITLIVLSIGLLGFGALQLNALKINDSANSRSQASLYAYEIMDRIRANRTAAVAGDYDYSLNPFSALPSPGSAVAATDRYDWYRKLDTVLPSFQGAINCDANKICTVTVQWDDARAEGSTIFKQVKLAGQI